MGLGFYLKKFNNFYQKTETTKPTNLDLNKDNQKIIANIAFKSRAGSTPGNVPKTNQDSFFVNKVKDGDFFGVCDGHGVNGHFVSQFLIENLISIFELFYFYF